jgi:hypothetical protein
LIKRETDKESKEEIGEFDKERETEKGRDWRV